MSSRGNIISSRHQNLALPAAEEPPDISVRMRRCSARFQTFSRYININTCTSCSHRAEDEVSKRLKNDEGSGFAHSSVGFHFRGSSRTI